MCIYIYINDNLPLKKGLFQYVEFTRGWWMILVQCLDPEVCEFDDGKLRLDNPMYSHGL